MNNEQRMTNDKRRTTKRIMDNEQGMTNEKGRKTNDERKKRTNVSLSSHPFAGENHEMTFWPFNTEGVALRTQRPLREKL